jgi:ATP-binding cassette subfamily B protein
VRKVDSTPHLFPGTVYENLVYGDPSANRDDVIAISQTLGLHDSVAQLPEGYDTVVGEGAYQVSVPVAQAISIARALVTKPGVILLDDVTAPFPPEAERQIIDGLHDLTTDITVVAAAGRPALVGLADDIAVLDHGALSAFGQYEQLIEESPAFREILEAWRLDLGPHLGGEQ